jgi:hypothetical protein
VRPRLYLILIAVVIMAAAIVVLVLNRDLPNEILGAIALLGGIAILLNAMLDLSGNGKKERHDQ